MMRPFLLDVVITLAWCLVGAVGMGISLVVLIKVFDWFTPINEWEEIKKGNIAVAILLGAAIVALAIVVATAIRPAG